jgi:hypothetical protein
MEIFSEGEVACMQYMGAINMGACCGDVWRPSALIRRFGIDSRTPNPAMRSVAVQSDC